MRGTDGLIAIFAGLTPEIEDDEELRKFLEENHDLIFEQELVEWIPDRTSS